MSKRVARQITMLEHAKKKSMWAGSQNQQTIECYKLIDGNFELTNLKYPPALLKIMDELIVNAIDHHDHYPKEVTEIKINITPETLTVYNNGPGIPIEQTTNVNGKTMYIPQLIASEFLAGDNLDDLGDNTKGGTNGVGLKLAGAFSTKMILETVSDNKHYIQEFNDGLTDIRPPTITNKKIKPYTRITVYPDYPQFKLVAQDFYPTLLDILQTRAYQAAAYTKAKIYFNDVEIQTKSFEDYCQKHTNQLVIKTDMTHEKYPWEVCFAASDGKERHLSIVNGVYIPKGGTHIQAIQNRLVEYVREPIEKQLKKSGIKFNKNYVLNNVFIFMKGKIPSPEFLSQTKEAISDPIEKFKEYNLAPKEWAKVWSLLEPHIMATFLKKQLGEVKLRANRSKVDVPKYKEARFCRDSKKCHQCGLIVTEGDSASGTADTGLLCKASESFNYDYFGVYGIQGVMMNGLKESITLDSKYLPNKKIMSNERISSLVKVLGLDFNKTYDLTPAGDKEWATLRYGYIVGLTDQDLDGFNIFGLLATFIMTYWPSLIKRQFLRRINTPIMRAYPKNRKDVVKEFYTEAHAKEWMATADMKKYDIKYYKGLGSHKQAFKEVSQMFKNIDKKICCYTLDDQALQAMSVYYGPDTAPRKVALSNPVMREAIDDIKLPISQHFEIDTKLYQRDNIIRKLLNVVDGFVSSRRKVFFVARKNGHKEIKVQGLAGLAVAEANYHHGEASLEQTIVRMAQGYPMARNLPLLLPLGNFGTRSKGYKDSAASRYIYTMINWRLADKLFRREDDYILEYDVEDGKRYEPKYYVPIVPYVLCENNEVPATGWAISIVARDIKSIFKNIRNMIAGADKCEKLPMWNKDFKGSVKSYKKRKWWLGVYKYVASSNMVHITELPPGVCSNTYLKGPNDNNTGIQSKDLIEDCEDYTTIDGVDIRIYLKPGAIDILQDEKSPYGNEVFDPLEDYLDLKAPIYDRINLVNEKGEVVEYDSYESVFNDWFKFRKDLYIKRVEREKIIGNLEVKMLQNIQRFSQNHTKYNIKHTTAESEADRILRENKYDIFNIQVLENPRFTAIEQLHNLIVGTENGANYDYLLRLSYRDLTEAAYQKRDQKIQELLDRLAYLNDPDQRFSGSKIWLKELSELEEAINEGLASEWFYGENKYRFE